MVSPLSSRILNAEAKANINGRNPIPYRPLTVNVVKSLQMQRKRGIQISGYTADRDVESPIGNLSPQSADANAHKEQRASHVEAQARKKRIAELNYQAFNIKNDLSRAGISSLPFLGRQKALPPGSVDMSTVKLIIATKDSPYYDGTIEESRHQTPQPQKGHVTTTSPCQYSYQEYASIIACSQHFYQGQVPASSEENNPHRNFEQSVANSRSTASCPSSIESDDSEMSFPELPTRLVDATPYNVNDKNDTSSPDVNGGGGGCEELQKFFQFIISTCSAKQNSKCLTLEEAIDETQSARLIVENAPSTMNVIHANAEFYQLTDVSTENDNVVGNSVTKLIQKHSSFHQSQSRSSSPFSSHMVSIKDKSFALTTYPIQNSNSETITHYSLELAELEASSSELSPVQLVG